MPTRRKEIKACPFCGAEGVDLSMGLVEAGDGEGNFVLCDFCEAEGPFATSQLTAIDAWNKRSKVSEGK
jgi:Lar family restriction alleviation protein